MNNNTKKTGFTLIELLVVVTIIGIIASITIVSLGQIRKKARDSRRVSDVRQTMLALELYYDDHLKYPEKGVVGLAGSIPASIPPYLDETPEDPGNIILACYPEGYRWWGNAGQAQKYCLWACLESGGFFVSSPKGAKLLENSPTDLDCW
ncbi:prepilin-type N-terminal cleavage/methylation domain-containing protein [Candidatus Parcubacteria bacterium]|nr:prepilin-type N-terminal cleavage/methylation domain-containing protein [Patescibacteria group bacterium]MBU4466914.1 prepilin-type N-terminal cleavage/methylation domain-containing protein [Patescibacteria group bacterium]MCG2688475.1 prepilin-type N-terminal cleavage/methylation domain-containing protein [Candidatus Parcubacteria bacterium]